MIGPAYLERQIHRVSRMNSFVCPKWLSFFKNLGENFYCKQYRPFFLTR